MMRGRKALMALMAVLVVALTACGISVPEDQTKLNVGAGPFQDPKLIDCKQPGTKDNSPTNNTYISYPVSGRDYDAGTTEGGDSGPITVISKDNTEMSIPIRITWDFNTDCESIKEFYKMYNRYSANLDEDGKPTKGWNLVLDKILGNSLDTTLDEVAKQYPWRMLYNDAAAQNALQAAVSENLQAVVDDVAKGEFFLNIRVATMKKPVPTNTALKDAIAAEQAAVATAQSAEAKAKAEEAQAKAEVAVAEAQAKKKAAEIAGFGGFAAYAQFTAIMQGLNPFQPTYIVGTTKP